MPDEAKLAITNCASRGSATSKTFGAVQHCSLLLKRSLLFVDHPSFTVGLHEPLRFSNACRLRRARSPAQLNVGIRLASKAVTERYEGFMALEGRPLLDARTSISLTLWAIVLLGIVHTQRNLDHS
jgi:hypothetical protein